MFETGYEAIVYIDVLFLVNFFINIMLLYVTGMIARKQPSLLLLSIGGIVSALYAVLMFFPPASIAYTFIAKLVFSALLMMLTFRTAKWRMVIKLTLIFYTVTFLCGGIVFALVYLTDAGTALGFILSNGEIYLDLPLWLLSVGVICAYAAVIFLTRITRRNFGREINKISVTIDGKTIILNALTDTGNFLSAPISGRGAIVVSFNKIKDLLPPNLRSAYESEDSNDLLKAITNYNGTLPLSIIPYSSVGQQAGIMLGIIPDRAVCLNSLNPNRCLKDNAKGCQHPLRCIICISRDDVSGDYDAIANPDVY